jgi:hypothetical protein
MQFKASGQVWRPNLIKFFKSGRNISISLHRTSLMSGDSETGNVLALGGENLSIEASGNFEKF